MKTFSIPRFLKFFSNEWKMTAKQTGLLWGGIVLVTLAFCILNNDEMRGIELDIWMFGVFPLLFIVAQGFHVSIQFGAFTSKVKKSALLLLPISKAEFLTAKMISCFVLFPLLYTGYVVGVAALMSWYNTAYFDVVGLYGRTLGSFHFFERIVWFTTICLPCATAVFWTGAFYFGKYSAVKSALTVLALYAGLTGLGYLLLGFSLGKWDMTCIPLFDYSSRSGFFWVADHAWLGFIETILRLGSVWWVVISVVKYNEKTL